MRRALWALILGAAGHLCAVARAQPADAGPAGEADAGTAPEAGEPEGEPGAGEPAPDAGTEDLDRDAGEDEAGGEAAPGADGGSPEAEEGDGADEASPELTAEEEEAEIAAELARIQASSGAGQDATTPAAAVTPAASRGSARGLSNLMNPAISATGLVLWGYTSRDEEERNEEREDLAGGITAQEIELRASAIVDPYFRADLTLSGSAEGVSFEEGFLSTLEIPRVTFRAGQMYASFGRHNLLHTHAFPFIIPPLPLRALLGPEGFKDPGLSADILLPLPFYVEVNAQTFAGEWAPFEGEIEDDPMTPEDESVPDRRRDSDLAYLGHLKILFDLTDSSTIELGGTYVGGRNGFARYGQVVGADLTIKWRPVEAERYRGFDWTTEYVWVDRPGDPTVANRRVGGAYTVLRYQLAQRWWVEAQGAVLGIPAGEAGRTYRTEALIAFVPSEFSALRLQYALEIPPETAAQSSVHEVFLQAIFSVGSHPSHAY